MENVTVTLLLSTTEPPTITEMKSEKNTNPESEKTGEDDAKNVSDQGTGNDKTEPSER